MDQCAKQQQPNDEEEFICLKLTSNLEQNGKTLLSFLRSVTKKGGSVNSKLSPKQKQKADGEDREVGLDFS